MAGLLCFLDMRLWGVMWCANFDAYHRVTMLSLRPPVNPISEQRLEKVPEALDALSDWVLHELKLVFRSQPIKHHRPPRRFTVNEAFEYLRRRVPTLYIQNILLDAVESGALKASDRDDTPGAGGRGEMRYCFKPPPGQR